MAPELLADLLDSIRTVFDLAADAEITLEVNPTAAEAERLGQARALGVNRLSVGVQSFDDANLRRLGRDHDAASARRTLGRARALGFDNLSLDLIFALPGQTPPAFERDVEQAVAFAPEHLSAYNLTLHPGTPFHRWNAEGKLLLPPEDVQAAMFESLMDRMEAAGYFHYEISNWSRPGRESRHNSKYWRARDVFAFGASAHGAVGGRRYANPRDLRAYAASPEGSPPPSPLWEAPPATPRAAAAEVMMLALRRVRGVSWEEIDGWSAGPARERYRAELAELHAAGLIENPADALRLTRRGILLADAVARRFF
jgi:oxygen-independent coproporphyrinogen-3 oxidase